jgi:uncharacterized flavoprotein (TIGR03862 family)
MCCGLMRPWAKRAVPFCKSCWAARPPCGGLDAAFCRALCGQPFKTVALSFTDSQGRSFNRRGEFVVTATGVEGSLVYAASQLLRDEIEAHGHATFHLDLLPDHSPERVLVEVRHPRGSRSLSSHLKSRLGLDGIKAGVLYEHLGKDGMNDPVALAHAIKALPITVVATRPLDEAISTAGGVAFEALDEHLMATAAPGVFCAGEMLDWEAPTGGYLLTASLASGVQAGRGFWRFWALALDGKAQIAIKNIAFDAGADDAPAPVPDGPIAGAVTSHLT